MSQLTGFRFKYLAGGVNLLTLSQLTLEKVNIVADQLAPRVTQQWTVRRESKQEIGCMRTDIWCAIQKQEIVPGGWKRKADEEYIWGKPAAVYMMLHRTSQGCRDILI